MKEEGSKGTKRNWRIFVIAIIILAIIITVFFSIKNGNIKTTLEKLKIVNNEKTNQTEDGPTIEEYVRESKIKIGDYIDYKVGTGTKTTKEGEYKIEQTGTFNINDYNEGWRVYQIYNDTIGIVSDKPVFEGEYYYLKTENWYEPLSKIAEYYQNENFVKENYGYVFEKSALGENNKLTSTNNSDNTDVNSSKKKLKAKSGYKIGYKSVYPQFTLYNTVKITGGDGKTKETAWRISN